MWKVIVLTIQLGSSSDSCSLSSMNLFWKTQVFIQAYPTRWERDGWAFVRETATCWPLSVTILKMNVSYLFDFILNSELSWLNSDKYCRTKHDWNSIFILLFIESNNLEVSSSYHGNHPSTWYTGIPNKIKLILFICECFH